MNGEFHVGNQLVQRDLNRMSDGDKTVQVEPKVMEVLVFLAEHPGEVLSREKIVRTIWNGTYAQNDS